MSEMLEIIVELENGVAYPLSAFASRLGEIISVAMFVVDDLTEQPRAPDSSGSMNTSV